jgi:hypothetical protein
MQMFTISELQSIRLRELPNRNHSARECRLHKAAIYWTIDQRYKGLIERNHAYTKPTMTEQDMLEWQRIKQISAKLIKAG